MEKVIATGGAVTDLFPDVLTSISNVEQDWTVVRPKEFGDLRAF